MAEQEHPEAVLRHLLGYVSLIREELRMSNWDIIVHREKGEDEDTHAETWQNHNHFTLNIKFGPDFMEQSDWQIRNTVVHELAHAQHRDLVLLWESCTLGNSDVPGSQARSWDSDFHIHLERFVSWITRFIAPTVTEFRRDGVYEPGPGCYLMGEQPD